MSGTNHFFAMMARMKYIGRWALMRNACQENISEHSLDVAMIAHALAVIGNIRFGRKLDENKAALIGMYHDATEIITGDLPTPVKYYNKGIKSAYKEVERIAAENLLEMLPEDMKDYYEKILFKQEEDEYLWRIVKAADKLSAYIKCLEEEKAGNSEFVQAKKSTWMQIEELKLEEVQVFCSEFLESYGLTLDELKLHED